MEGYLRKKIQLLKCNACMRQEFLVDIFWVYCQVRVEVWGPACRQIPVKGRGRGTRARVFVVCSAASCINSPNEFPHRIRAYARRFIIASKLLARLISKYIFIPTVFTTAVASAPPLPPRSVSCLLRLLKKVAYFCQCTGAIVPEATA